MNPVTCSLWPDGAPGALGQKPADIPSIALYPPTAPANGAAILVFPGGGYEALMDYEGEAYAVWLASQGYYGMVVNYRLTSGGYTLPQMTQDGIRAVRWARSRAVELGFDPSRIGIIGSSAGGHMCALLGVHWDLGDPDSADPVERVSSRPDLVVLCYAVIKFWGERSRERLFGGHKPSAQELDFFAASDHVQADTPPCFLFHTVEDQLVPVSQALLFAQALESNRVPFELHLYQRGSHGLALGSGHPWTQECLRWLKENLWR